MANQQPFYVEMSVTFISFRPICMEDDEEGITKVIDHGLKHLMANGTEVQIQYIECEAGDPADLM